ncbi:MAG TPA: hypothetical protein VG406_29405, partial [Isosphaeraceae bacterium]|nr:hypothetical protein [Isosphaeraceae bacterium]
GFGCTPAISPQATPNRYLDAAALHDHLIDSNIDWGQDLFELERWLRQHPEARPIGLAYFNMLDPKTLGIDYYPAPGAPNYLFRGDQPYQARFGPVPGYFAVSVTLLRGLSFDVADGHGGRKPAARGDYEYFRRFTPIARAGYSIYIYHITNGQADSARLDMGLPPLPPTPHRTDP